MINNIISFSIRNKFIIGLFTLALIGIGIYSMKTINLGSVPDITNNQVQVMTVSPNLATEDIEQFITYPVEMAMGNLPGVNEIRSVSRFGLSVVTIVFDDDMGIYKPRQLVQENSAKSRIKSLKNLAILPWDPLPPAWVKFISTPSNPNQDMIPCSPPQNCARFRIGSSVVS